MFTVSTSVDYEGSTLCGVYAAENEARLLARKLRTDRTSDYVTLSFWTDRAESVIARWAYDWYGKGWYLADGVDDK